MTREKAERHESRGRFEGSDYGRWRQPLQDVEATNLYPLTLLREKRDEIFGQL
jgi:hypothetical protein